MYQAAVVAGGVVGVVGVGAEARLDIAALHEKGGTVEGGAEARHDSLVHAVVTLLNGERSAIAAPNVQHGRLYVATVVALAGELVTLDAALDLSSFALRVDREVFLGVLLPHLLDVLVIVAVLGARVVGDVHVRGHDTEGVALGILDAHVTPGLAILGTLGLETRTDLGHGVAGQALDGLGLAAAEGQLHAENQTDEVDEGDVSPDTGLLGVGQLDEAPVDGRGGVLRVGRRRLYQLRVAVTVDDGEELQLALGDPHAARGHVVGNGDVRALTLAVQRDRYVGIDLDGLGAACGVGEVPAAVALEHDDGAAGVLGGHVGEQLAAKVVGHGDDQRLARVGQPLFLRARHVRPVQGVLLGDDQLVHTARLHRDWHSQRLGNERRGRGQRQSVETSHFVCFRFLLYPGVLDVLFLSEIRNSDKC